MTKEQKSPLAEPATYTPPQMEVIPLRGNSAMLIGSTIGRGVITGSNPIDITFSSSGEELGNTATDVSNLGNDYGWGSSF